MKKRILQKDPAKLTETDVNYCQKCGHWIDTRLYKKTELTRWFFEKICKFCQREVEDPNPERTRRISQC